MNMATVLRTPLRATPAYSRWTMLVVMVLLLALATALQCYQPLSPPSWIPALFSAFGEYLIGIGFLAPCLLLAIDGAQLRLPGVQRPVVLGMLCYAVLSVVIPSVILCLAGSPPSMAFAFQALCLVIGLACGVMPRVFMITIMLTPSFLTAALTRFHHPVPQIITYLWIATAVFVAVTVAAWRQQVRKADPYRLNAGTALVMAWDGGWKAKGWRAGNAMQGFPLSTWRRSVADVRGCGPQHLQRSLRVLLGGWLMPKTWPYTLGLCAFVVLPITAFVMIMHAQFPGSLLDLWRAFRFYAVSWLANFTSLLLGVLTASLIQRRWMKANAELPLMALLPGLGEGSAQLKHVLQASLLPTLCLQLPMTLLLCVAAATRHVSVGDAWSAVIGQITALAFAPAFVLATLGGRALPNWVTGTVAGVSLSMLGLSLGAGQWANAAQITDYPPLTLLMVVRLAVPVFLAWLGYRGWHGLTQRPHPFLSS
jgi:hypothetical protein